MQTHKYFYLQSYKVLVTSYEVFSYEKKYYLCAVIFNKK